MRNVRYEAGNAVAYGMDWNAALRAITLTPAEIFGVADRVGSLQVGKLADVVIWSGDPFEFASQPERVFVRGVQVTTPSRQDLLEQRYKTLPPNYRRRRRGGYAVPRRSTLAAHWLCFLALDLLLQPRDFRLGAGEQRGQHAVALWFEVAARDAGAVHSESERRGGRFGALLGAVRLEPQLALHRARPAPPGPPCRARA